MVPRAALPACLTVLAVAALVAGCTSASPAPSVPSGQRAQTAASANAEQLELLDTLMRAAPSRWNAPTVHRFRTCTTRSGQSGVQITREVRGSGVPDEGAAAKAIRSALTERGYDAEIRRVSEVTGTAHGSRYAAFNADGSASILQAYSACYAFDLDSGEPTVPPSPVD